VRADLSSKGDTLRVHHYHDGKEEVAMSEYINNSSKREEQLKGIIKQLHAGRAFADLRDTFQDLLQGASAQEIVQIEQALIAEGLPVEQIQFLCDAHVALFKEALDAQLPPEMQPGHPIYTFRAENELAELLLHALDEKLTGLKQADSQELRDRVAADIEKLQQMNLHYLRKEHLLFPLLERYGFNGPSAVMWGIHDEIRAGWSELAGQIAAAPVADMAAKYDALQHTMREMIYKEEHILFPNALERLTPPEWGTVYAGEAEIGFAFVTRGQDWKPQAQTKPETPLAQKNEDTNEKEMDMVELTLSVGKLSAKQVDLLLKNLPIDVTFVDENDQVAFYSQSRDRIFARTPAVIGRKVQMCHPPASVHKVQQILDDFRAGKRSEAGFWIQMNGKFIHIRYFAVRDEDGAYRGTIEVTQDITELRKLEGEKRLLDD
jgi:DUF438 domain-containing protein